MSCTNCLGKPQRVSETALQGNGSSPWSRNACTISPQGSLHEPSSFAPVTTGSLTLLLTVFNLVTLWRLLRNVVGPVSGSLRKLQAALSTFQDLEQSPNLGPISSMEMPAGFHLLTLNVEHTVKTKIVALRQLLQWSGYLAVVFLHEIGTPPPPGSCFTVFTGIRSPW